MSNMLQDVVGQVDDFSKRVPLSGTVDIYGPTDGFIDGSVYAHIPSINIVTKMVDTRVKFVFTHPEAKLPTKAHDTDTGFDVYATELVTIAPGQSKVVPIGLKLGYITPGYWIMVSPRSGLGFKYNLTVHPGVIDETYRGSLDILVRNLDQNRSYTFNVGDRVAQLIVFRNYNVEVERVDEVEATTRGDKGFGSSGR